jgi:RNA polymerase sigma factor (sigma-70 family)
MTTDTLFNESPAKWMALANRVAERIIYQYKVPPKEHDDVYSDTNIGVIQAMRQFDPDKCEKKNLIPYMYRTTFYRAILNRREICGRENTGRAKVRAMTRYCLDNPRAFGYEEQEFVPANLLTYDTPPATTEEEFRLHLGSFDCLSERDIDILTMYFYKDTLMKDIGKAIGLAKSRVSQIINGSITLLKEAGYETVLERLML